MKPHTQLYATAAILFFAPLAVLMAAETPVTVWAGVYSAEQAQRGKTAYDANCSSCHGPYLEGFRTTGSAKALAREPFMDRWDGGTLDELFEFMRTNMPRSGPERLSDDIKLDILAYILQVNEFPAGSTKLDATSLAGVRIQSKAGVRPPKNGMTVQAIGCVTQEGTKWMLTRATDPLRARTDALSSGAELAANAKKTGTTTVELVDAFPEPVEYKGQKIEVKGMFVNGQPPGINVLGLQKVADRCE